MRKIRHIGIVVVLAAIIGAGAVFAEEIPFGLQNFPGTWAFVTNDDSTITATGNAVFRHGDEVYHQVFLFKAIPSETAGLPQKATEADIRNFIRHFRPPPIPYTSEKTARKTGAEKFNCLEFAEDLVAQAESNGIPAEVIGIKFKGKLVGHACAGFPAADGRMLYFDSTPSSGRISHGAHEARVVLGEPYRRADGGELAGGAENLPITQIIPVTRLEEIASGLLDEAGFETTVMAARLVVVGEKHLPVEGVDYAGPDTLKISDSQRAKWDQAAEEFAATQSARQLAEKIAAAATAKKLAALALAENKRLAAQGDAYGELRMGERYLAGDGVAKDIFRARDYLQRAAEQGSQTAADELNRLDNQ